jgi:hypothetical protein
MYPSPNLVVVEFPRTLGITTGGSAAQQAVAKPTRAAMRKTDRIRKRLLPAGPTGKPARPANGPLPSTLPTPYCNT